VQVIASFGSSTIALTGLPSLQDAEVCVQPSGTDSLTK
jgi:hypothetical protein